MQEGIVTISKEWPMDRERSWVLNDFGSWEVESAIQGLEILEINELENVQFNNNIRRSRKLHVSYKSSRRGLLALSCQNIHYLYGMERDSTMGQEINQAR